ncbi:MAG: hypothetical protein AAB397_00575 [Patescibacteria group bacterium]
MELKLKHNGKQQKRLIGLPESGMGYQIIDITLKDGRIIKGVLVCGAENIYLPTGYENICEKDIVKIEMSN